jgi:hypothetical protein
MGALKKLLDTDSKNIYLMLNNFDTLQTLTKRVEKSLEDGSKLHYNDLAKKHKKRIIKTTDIIATTDFNLRIHLKMAILYEILDKIDKSKSAYGDAYVNITQIMFPHYLS